MLRNVTRFSRSSYTQSLRLCGRPPNAIMNNSGDCGQMGSQSKRSKVMTLETMNPLVKKMEYAVRGPIVARASEIEKELKDGVKKPFPNVIKANIGDCHACGQKPITFLRQVVALCTYPDLLNSEQFPADAKDRARRILGGCKGGSIGSYSDSPGVEVIRRDIAAYIQERDGGIPCDYNNVFVSTGASDSIKSIMTLLIKQDEPKAGVMIPIPQYPLYSATTCEFNLAPSVLKLTMTGKENPKAGVMIPIPQYPLYTATLAEYNAQAIPYYMNEANAWSLDTAELERSLNAMKDKCAPRAIVVINPGNPTGNVLTRNNIEEIIKFAYREGLFILADEVYQHNVYKEGAAFYSFKKVLTELGDPYDKMELASFMSTSKGYMGECGYRGGYCEAINLDPDVKAMLFKSISAKLCPSVSGQAAMDVVVNPPRPGEPSYDLWKEEKDTVLRELNEKAKMATKIMNSIEGVSLNEVAGAMYAFVRLHLPQRAIDAAKAKNMAPDAFYCFQLLEETGICVVPGSGFGQAPDTHHFRMTILPPVPALKELLERFKGFHVQFMAQYK